MVADQSSRVCIGFPRQGLEGDLRGERMINLAASHPIPRCHLFVFDSCLLDLLLKSYLLGNFFVEGTMVL